MSEGLTKDFTKGNIFSNLIKFSIPYLFSCFLQTFYGMADLFITGQFYGPDVISAVSVGSQFMHMVTVIIAGLSMGATVYICRAVGSKNRQEISKTIGTSVLFFIIFSVVLSFILIFGCNLFLRLISTPEEAFREAKKYCLICFGGVIFITAYNILSSIYRGLGDTKSPLLFVLVAGIFNIILDYVLIGYLKLGAAGAALATIISQALSVVFAIIFLHAKQKKYNEVIVEKKYFKFDKVILGQILKTGVPVALQDGFIQISFLVITAIANSRGVQVAAAVGIVEKIICFLFLVPSAMMSSVSAISAQNGGAGKDNRSFKTLGYGILICVVFGVIITVLCNIWPEEILSIFVKDNYDSGNVIILGAGYLRSYVTDCIVAGIHFCFSGFFCAYGKSMYSFIHNILSICLIRIPGAYFASVYYPDTLFPMGMAAPLGSLFSAILCFILFLHLKNKISRKK